MRVVYGVCVCVAGVGLTATDGPRLQRFEKTNAKLAMFNESSETHLAAATHHFKRHTQLLLDAKKDLNAIFRRIRCGA